MMYTRNRTSREEGIRSSFISLCIYLTFGSFSPIFLCQYFLLCDRAALLIYCICLNKSTTINKKKSPFKPQKIMSIIMTFSCFYRFSHIILQYISGVSVCRVSLVIQFLSSKSVYHLDKSSNFRWR